MTSENGSRAFLIGGTLLMATMDGALFGTISAIGIGWIATKRLTALAIRPSEVAIETEIAKVQRDADNESDSELRKKKVKEAENYTKRMRAELIRLRGSAGDVSNWVGLGVFAAPIAGVAIAVASEIEMRRNAEEAYNA